MKSSRLVASLVSLALLTPAYAADRSRSIELARLISADEIVAGIMKYGLRRKQQETGMTDAQLACVDAVPSSKFTDAVVAAISQGLTDAELTSAMEFYRSAAGKKQISIARSKMSGKTAEQFTPEEIAQIEKYMATATGEKVVSLGYLNSSDVISQRMMEVNIEALENCGKPTAR